MNEEKKADYSVFYYFLLIIPVVIPVLLWSKIKLGLELKLILLLFIDCVVFLIACLFMYMLRYVIKNRSPLFYVIISLFLFLAFPISNTVVYDNHTRVYLEAYPNDNKIHIRIICDVKTIKNDGSIGHEWTYEHYLNDQKFNSGDTLAIDARSDFTITSKFIEHDSGSDDIGKTISPTQNYSQQEDYSKDIIITQNVHAAESGGRKYAGATADFEAKYTITRVVPSSMSAIDMILFTTIPKERGLCKFLISGQIISLVLIALTIFGGWWKKAQSKKRAIEEEQRKKEEIFLDEKSAFLARLNGQSIREAAGVPSHVFFRNGLPIDNNDAPYGSFTVYYSRSGRCFHDKQGCCSAILPGHYFQAKNQYWPCYKCCKKNREIPKWYTDYRSLKEQAKKYHIEFSE